MAALRLVLALLWVGIAASSVVDLQKRIIGGQPCGQHERRYHVLLERTDGRKTFFCGGSLIHTEWILTAAHCWVTGWRMFATLGVHTGSAQTVEITDPPLTYKKANLDHDLMLLKLPGSTRISTAVRPIALPDCQNQPILNQVVQIAGQASTTMGRSNTRQPGFTPNLQCADINVADCTQLRALFRGTRRDHQHWFCGQTPRKDACFGDSGGGVEYQDKIYGVISFTGDSQFACSRAAGLMKICHADYFKWIKNTIDPKQNCLSCFG